MPEAETGVIKLAEYLEKVTLPEDELKEIAKHLKILELLNEITKERLG